jgi:pimeloyl-ACP methyl ester carboxylesterase
LRNYEVTCQGTGGSHRIHVTEWGEADNPNILMCVHGLTRCGRDFDVLAQHLADRYRVLCPDIAGRGQSEWLNNKADYNYPQYVSDLVRVIAKTGQKSVHWVGTSMGGILGMLLAAQPNSPITRMVVNDMGAFIPKASLQRIGAYVGASPAFDSIDAAVQAVRSVSPFGPLTDQQWRELTLPLMSQNASGKWCFRYDPAIGDAFKVDEVTDVDLSEYWDAIRCPVLVTRGEDSDLLLKSTFDQMCQKPLVQGVTIPNTGHAPMFQDEASIATVRNFLLAAA